MADPHLRELAFPTLDAGQVAQVGRCSGASLERYPAGQALFQVGDRDFKFFVIESGEVEVIDPSGDTPKTLVVHGPGQFTGDVAHLTGSRSIVTAVARVDSQVYAISPAGLQELLNGCPDLGDRILQAFIARRQLLRESGDFTGVRVIGSRYSRDTLRIRDFLTRNLVPFRWLDLETEQDVDTLLGRFGVSHSETPVVAWRELLLRNPSNRELAEALGIRRPLGRTVYDLAVVGCGPAGLAAAVYGASEGLSTLVLERTAPGGQASGTMRIENYLGFPTAVSGRELAERAVLQATKFGASLSVASPVTGLTFENGYSLLRLESGETTAAKCVLIATGADYRRLIAEGCEPFEGSGVYYAATINEAQVCEGGDVVIVGGGNAAGQAAVFLAGRARKVFLLIRGDSIYENMSAYLARRIERTPNFEVLTHTTVVRLNGDRHLSAVTIVDGRTGEMRTLNTMSFFSFIGAVPRTDWLPPEIERDDHRFVRTGPAIARSAGWTAGREPFLLETSRHGVFAAGDVRAGSVKRFASAVGEGAMAVQFVHEYLKTK
ncbi:cyclic nucleotide-binding domain-containing thioredoxin-disulfide reductase [Anaeromyxobacter sp. Fw109-5]|uniref:FAD-dependent oxidoreductase n=1 Tax=Anaeromyxobacter sp. (strain Fw109-5) TaxID=404589 RepID=UPI0000ED8BAA|nr:cyclic nucleotide-binding domain-containing thioredoxin-disulfide reductase [Anaeromyxobacter sp. Fw109-5]ABS27498.1 cyclic nucleotide-regulated FAD-dependent pyridine nucleotide-disulphide oxidoreductase [Anaeromyxobacter sp. Fw109-5]